MSTDLLCVALRTSLRCERKSYQFVDSTAPDVFVLRRMRIVREQSQLLDVYRRVASYFLSSAHSVPRVGSRGLSSVEAFQIDWPIFEKQQII